MNGYLLDTNMCIFAIKENPFVVKEIRRRHPESIHVASMTVAELLFGVRKSRRQARNQAVIDAFLEPLTIVDFDLRAAAVYADMRWHLESAGNPIGERDLIIAATGSVNNLTVVTNNSREFKRLPGLPIEDWTK